jgi:5-methylcytosine-specific restriction endonuclease McrA
MIEKPAIRPLEIFSELYVGDYFADTLELSASEHDAFRLLLMRLWLVCTLPTSDLEFAHVTGLPIDDCSGVRKTLGTLLKNAASRIERWKQAVKALDGQRLPAEYWRVVRAVALERDRYTCVYCGTEERLHVDHRVAVVRGGSNSFDNLVTCCGPCNWSKGSKPLEEWVGPRTQTPFGGKDVQTEAGVKNVS